MAYELPLLQDHVRKFPSIAKVSIPVSDVDDVGRSCMHTPKM